MWSIGAACPEFRVRTPAGAIGPADLRGAWLALLHCTRPCTAGCSRCLAGFGSLAARLAERGCRLVVALDEPDAALRALLGQLTPDRRAPLLIGTWETPEPRHAPCTRFAVVDPHGTVRGLLERPNAEPLAEGELLAAVDRAVGRPRTPRRGTVSAAESFGCVDWFDYGAGGAASRNER